MRPEDISQAKKLIAQSNILSSVERAEWTQLIPEMNDKQLLELIRILSDRNAGAMPMPTPASARPAFASQQKPPAIIGQKEITTSIPFYEPELPKPRPAVISDPGELQKKVESIVREMDQRKTYGQAAPTPAQKNLLDLEPPLPSVDLQSFLEQDHQEVSRAPMPELQRSELKSREDIAALTPKFMANADPSEAVEKIYQAIVSLSKKAPLYSIVAAYEQSPLYQAYLRLGEELLNDPNPNRLQAYDSAGRKNRALSETLNKEQFEYLTDLRSRLSDLY